MKYIAKPNLFNSDGIKEFSNSADAVKYLDKVLSEKTHSTNADYSFIRPSKKHAVEDYTNMGKLICK